MRVASILRWSTFAFIVLAGAGLAFAYSQGQFVGLVGDERPLALLGARIYDPVLRTISEDMTVIIEGRFIVSVGDEHAVLPEGARILDVRDLTLMPGFIDSNVRISGIAADPSTGTRDLGWLPYFWKFVRKFPDRRRQLIQAGVTTVRSVGDPHPWVAMLADRTARHELAGPRVLFSGPVFTAPGGQPVARLRAAGQGDTSFIAQVTRQVADTAQARIAVNRLSGNVDFIAAVVDRRNPDGLPGLRRDVLRAIVRTAASHHLATAAYIGSVRDINAAIDAGVTGIEGMPGDAPIDLATLSRLRDGNIFVDPMLEATQRIESRIHRDRARMETVQGNVRRLHEVGVTLVAGSGAPNTGTLFGRSLHAEMERLVTVGLEPADALAAATSDAAAYLGLQDRLGRIAAGRFADIVAVAGNPLINISDAARIRLVIADGRVLVDKLGERRRRHGVVALQNGRPGDQ